MSGEVVDATLEDAAPRIVMSLRDLVGTELDGRYLLRKVLGEGAMGVVFRATQRSVGRDVAVKLLKLEQFRSQDSYERFQREMSIIGGLKHPNVVGLLDSGRDERLGVFYLVMELVEGVSLGDLIYEPPRPARVEFALEVIYQICAALTEPHRRGIIHRDIKPDNVLLVAMSDDTLQVKLVDFGVARAADGQDRVTATGVVVGTPAYMAPELCQASGISPATDLYAVGVMLFELITGAVPFEANTSMAVILKHIQEQPPLLTAKLKGDFPYPEIVHLVQQLLAKRPGDRPATAMDVRERIDEIRERYPFKRVRVDGGLAARRAFEPWLLTSNPARQSQYRSAEVVPTATLVTTPEKGVDQSITLERGVAPRPMTQTPAEQEALRATPDRSATSIGLHQPEPQGQQAMMTTPMLATASADAMLVEHTPRPAWMMPLAALGVMAVLLAGGAAIKLAADPAKPAAPQAPIVAEQPRVAPPQDKPADSPPVEVKSAQAPPAEAEAKPQDPPPAEVKPQEVPTVGKSKPRDKRTKVDPAVAAGAEVKVEPKVEPKIEPKIEPTVEPKIEPKVDPPVDKRDKKREEIDKLLGG